MSGTGGAESQLLPGISRPALYSGTTASVVAQPPPGGPAPSWWTRQKRSGRHAGSAREDGASTGQEG